MAYQILVTNEGIINKAIEVGKLITTVNKARLIDGSPSPITPFTTPATKNVAKMENTVKRSNITGY